MPKGSKKKNKKAKQQQKKHNHAEDREWKRKNKKKFGKKNSYNKDFRLFTDQLSKLNLYIREMTGDGNCLFRAISDQLYSNEHNCNNVRETLCNHIETNRNDFEPFIEDDEPFETYLQRMRENAEWGGNFELAAAVQCFGVTIVVHNLQAPRYQLTCHNSSSAIKDVGGGTIHVSYHDGEHYNSVRIKGDQARIGRALPTTTIKMLEDPTANQSTTKTTSERLDIIRLATGCNDLEHIAQMLQDCENDSDATIECLVAELAAGAEWNESNESNESTCEAKWSTVKTKKTKKKKKLTKKEKKAEKRRQRQLQRNGGGKDDDSEDDDIDEFGALVI